MDIYKTWYEQHATRGHLTVVPCNFILSVTPTWRLYKQMSWNWR